MAHLDPRMLRLHLDRLAERRDAPPGGALSFSLPFAVGVSLLVGCGGGEVTGDRGECDGQNCADACTDDADNDGDGATDCADSDCANVPNCMAAEYGVPYEPEEDCANGVDDDDDGDVDCADADCVCAMPLYAAPSDFR